MRWLSILCALVGLVLATPAIAGPSVAIAPIRGDTDDKVGNAIADILEEDADIKGPTPTGKAMSKLDLSGELTVKDKKALFKKLGVDALVEGKLDKAGAKKKSLTLEVTPKGKKSTKFTVEFKSAASDGFREEVRKGILKRIGAGDDDEVAEKKKPKDRAKDKEKAKADREDVTKSARRDRDRGRAKDRDDRDDEDRDDEDRDRKRGRKKDRVDDEDADRKKSIAERDEDGGSVRSRKQSKSKSKRRSNDDDDDDDGVDGDEEDGDTQSVRHVVTQRAIGVHLGAGFGMRSLTYVATGDNIPPRVGTPNASARFEAELYPLAFDKLTGASGLGVYGDYDKTLGLSIAVPGAMGQTAAVDQASFSIGARYRLPIGLHSLAFGAAYAKRKYVIDRSGAGAMLDVPDVSYAAIAPGAVFRIAAGPKVGISLGANAMLMLDAGPIATKEQYGSGSIIAFELDGGVDIALGKSYALHFAAELTQIGIAFSGKGAMSGRGVSSATDRSIGGSASFAITY